jgi:uncharacterized protein YegL
MSESFVYDVPKTLPVILLLDNSGSMASEGNIIVLNQAVNMMLQSFKDLDSDVASISVSIISFGQAVNMVNKLLSVHDVKDINLTASGNTPFGGALNLAKQMIEEKESFPSRSYRPTIITVSDGMPNDQWEIALDDFKTTGRSSKCHCMAMSIGARKDTPAFNVLSKFADGDENVFFAENARDIHKFFRLITSTIKTRTQSINPNLIPLIDLKSIPLISDDDDILY